VERGEPSLDLLGADRPVSVSRTVVAVVAALLLASCTSAPSDDAEPPASRAASASATASATASASTSASGSASASVAPDARRTTDAVLGAPAVGDCHRLTFRQLSRASNASPPVPCSGRHNAVTIHVGELDPVARQDSATERSEKVLAQISTVCPRRLASYVGGSRSSRALTRFHVVWFTPTDAQSAAGASWFRCDLVAFAGQERLAPLPRPGRLVDALDRPAARDVYGLCGTAAPGTADFERVVCSRRHSWRAISTIRLQGGARYPGARAVRTAGEETCSNRVRRRSGSPVRFSYGWEWPSRDQWRRGQRHGFCWAPD
jgi:hypothetical protein